jgi:hypothetical protein
VGGDRQRSEVVVSLLAVLELVRLGRIRTQQTELFGDIVIERQSGAATAALPLTSEFDEGGAEGLEGGAPAAAGTETSGDA